MYTKLLAIIIIIIYSHFLGIVAKFKLFVQGFLSMTLTSSGTTPLLAYTNECSVIIIKTNRKYTQQNAQSAHFGHVSC